MTGGHWRHANVDAARTHAGVGDQSDECRNGNERCPTEDGLPCLDCLLDGSDDGQEVATDGGEDA